MSVPFFIGEERLKTKIGKIGLASIFLLGLAVSHVAANETEVAKISQDATTVSSSSGQNQSSNKTQTSTGVKTNASAHWDGDYYVKADGSKAKSEWIFDKNYGAYYYLTSEGSYSYSTWVGDYYVKSNGKMATKEWIFDKNYDSYYYLTSEGSYARNIWVGDYYLKSNGKLAVNERTPDGYQVDSSGKWVK